MRFLLILLIGPLLCMGQTISPDGGKTAQEALFTEATLAFITEDYNTALKHFETFIKLDEQSAAAYYMKSRVESALGMSIQAEMSALKATELEQQLYYLSNLAEILKKNNKLSEAGETFKRIIKIQPDKVEHYIDLVKLQESEGKYTDAVKTLDQITKQFGESDSIALFKQQVLLKDNKLSQALKEGKSVNNPDFTLEQVDLLLKNSEIKQAIKLLENTVDEHNYFEEAVEKLAGLYTSTKEESKLKNLLNKVISDDVYSNDLNLSLTEKYLAIADKKEGSLLEILLKMLNKLAAEQTRAYQYIGDIFIAQNKPVEARDAYTTYLKKNKNHYDLWIKLARLNFEVGDFKAMEKMADEATMYFPNHPELWFYAGFSQLLNGNVDDAELSIEQAEYLNPSEELQKSINALKAEYDYLNNKRSEVTVDNKSTNQTELFLTSKRLLSDGEAEEATNKFRKLSLDYPLVYIYQIFLIQSLLKSDKVEEAAGLFMKIDENIVELSAIGLETKGDLLNAQGESEQARSSWEKALNLDRSNQNLREKLK